MNDELTVNDSGAPQGEHAKYLRIANQLYNDSTDYLDASIRPKWDKALALMNNTHPPGSPYFNEGYQHRSKSFRPKVKPAVRRQVAAMASALFTNNDVVFLQPEDQSDKAAGDSARMMQEILQNRLDNDLNWFEQSLGAYQDSLIYSICVSKQFWAFDEGVTDKPVLELIKPENFRFDPAASWTDTINSSPYLIEIIPMVAGDLLNKIKGNSQWIDYTLAEIISAGAEQKDDQTRRARDGSRVDSEDIATGNEFSTVYVHFNIYRENGEDVAFYTIGTTLMLSEPRPLLEMYSHGRSLYALGRSSLETHKTYPLSLVDDSAGMQEDINQLVNTRIDNVRLAMNKRFFIKRQGNVDLQALMRNVPGGGIMVDSVDDVRWSETPDVTRSAYEEQDRLERSFDFTAGIVDTNTIQANRASKETVAGMNLATSGASSDQELMMMMFINSWVKPVLRTILKLIQLYETNETIINKAAQAAGTETGDEHFNAKISLDLNVGLGNTNPEQKVRKLMLAINTVGAMPMFEAIADWEQIFKEVFSYAGYGNGDRFIKDRDKLAQEQAEKEGQPPQEDPIEAGKIKQLEMRLQFDAQMQQLKIQHEKEMLAAKTDAAERLEAAKLEATLHIGTSRIQTDRDKTALQEQNKLNEMALKRRMGSGI